MKKGLPLPKLAILAALTISSLIFTLPGPPLHAQMQVAPQHAQVSPLTLQQFEELHKDKGFIFYLFDISIELKEDYSYTATVHKKVKVLKEQAKEMGELPIPYENNRETITGIEAYAITPDGAKHKYSRIQDLKMYEEYGMYSDSTMKIITFPQVNVGSVLEYIYTITANQGPIAGAWWNDVRLSFYVPVKEVNYTVTIPKSISTHYKEFNMEYVPVITENDSTITYSWHLEDIYQGGETENYIPPTHDIIKNVAEFSTIQSWDDVSSWYYALIEKNLNMTQDIKQAAADTTKGLSTTKEKVRAILEYIQDNFRYVSMSFGEHKLEPHPPEEVFKNKYGDCKDLSLMCMAMLKANGIKSCIALFNDEYSIVEPQEDPPMPTLFSHVLLLVEDPAEGDFYIDPLLKGYDIGQFPLAYEAGYTFVITENGGRFDRFPVADEKKHYKRSTYIIDINADGSALVENDILWDLDYSIKIRDTLNAMDEEDKKQFFEMLDAGVVKGGKMLWRHIEGLNEKYGPITTNSKYNQPDRYPVTGNMIIIDSPGAERTTNFTEKERKHPIFYPNNSLTETMTTYRIPEGFTISHLPENLDLDIGFLSYTRHYETKKDEIIIKTESRTKRMTIPKEDYHKVKEYCDSTPTKLNQRIILKKKISWRQKIKDLWHRRKDIEAKRA